MHSGVPNMAMCLGYTNASWILRADLSSLFVCQILNHMDRRGYDQCVLKPGAGLSAKPLLDLSSGYVARAAAHLPKQGTQNPWYLRQNYLFDSVAMKFDMPDCISRSVRRKTGARAGSSRGGYAESIMAM